MAREDGDARPAGACVPANGDSEPSLYQKAVEVQKGSREPFSTRTHTHVGVDVLQDGVYGKTLARCRCLLLSEPLHPRVLGRSVTSPASGRRGFHFHMLSTAERATGVRI